jgi:hypothetical protein
MSFFGEARSLQILDDRGRLGLAIHGTEDALSDMVSRVQRLERL